MFIGDHARRNPAKAALVNSATGEAVSYGQLDARSSQFANCLHGSGLRRGDHIALMMENTMCFHEIVWAALRSGLYVTAINRYSTADEASYIVNNSSSKALILSANYMNIAADISDKIPGCPNRVIVGARMAGWHSYEEVLADQPKSPLMEQWFGDTMTYSSGTTGRPKGIKRPLRDARITDGEYRMLERMRWYGFSEDCIFLSPAPLYHASPLHYSIGVHFLGGTVVMMEKFDAEEALKAIERYRVSHSQWVPTMFIRLLRLRPEIRNRYDLSSLRVAMIGAAPCPAEVKRQMIAWWGDRVVEYYGASESVGSTLITAAEWLERPGSIGLAKRGNAHICSEEGDELPRGSIGLLYFENAESQFSYHKDEKKTEEARNRKHPNWFTVGDIGYMDEDGYIYLTDRKAFTIISGGVNIYPQAVEDALALHPKVEDVAVIGVPDEEFGESVKAVIELPSHVEPTDELKRELIDFLHSKIARHMIPKSIDFIDRLPRLPTGKLYKEKLRERYWPEPHKRVAACRDSDSAALDGIVRERLTQRRSA